MTTDLQHLLDALADPSQPIQHDLLEAASDLDSPRLQAFQTAWSSWDPARRIQILEHLGQLADEDIELNFDRINRLALGDEEPRIRRQAIQNLWECEDPSLGQQLAGLVEADSAAEVRATAAAALGRFIYLGEIEEIDEALLRQVEARLLAAQRDDPQEAVRLRSLESLGYSSRPEIAAADRNRLPLRAGSAHAVGVEGHGALGEPGVGALRSWRTCIMPRPACGRRRRVRQASWSCPAASMT